MLKNRILVNTTLKNRYVKRGYFIPREACLFLRESVRRGRG